MSDNTVPFPTADGADGGDGGGNLEQRIRRLEMQLATLEERSRHTATKAWVLAGVLGGMATAAGMATAIALTVVRLFWNSN